MATYVKKLQFVCQHARVLPLEMHTPEAKALLGAEVDIWKIDGAIRIVVIYLDYLPVYVVTSHDGCRGVGLCWLDKIKINPVKMELVQVLFASSCLQIYYVGIEDV